MLKNILNLNGAQELSKNEQQSINGGGPNGCGAGVACSSQTDCDNASQISPDCPSTSTLYCRIPVGSSSGICHYDWT